MERHQAEEYRYMMDIEAKVYDSINLYKSLTENKCPETVEVVVRQMQRLLIAIEDMFEMI